MSTFEKSDITVNPYPENQAEKVDKQLLYYAYDQIKTSQVAAILSATIVLIGLHQSSHNNYLYIWYASVLMAAFVRVSLWRLFLRQKDSSGLDVARWRNLFFVGVLLGGVSWGALGWFIFPNVELYEKMLCILVLAGITAGATPVLSGLHKASVIYLVTALVPFIIQIIIINSESHTLFLYDVSITVYLLYMLLLAKRSHVMIKSIIELQFSNETLLNELSLVNLELEEMATHDPLTHVNNTFLFNTNLKNAIKRADRDNKMLALLYLDVDKFKNVNDKYGHHVGDLILQMTAQRISGLLRESDIIARLGGDEFVVILEKIESKADPIFIAKMICEKFTDPFEINQNLVLCLTISVGISIYPENGLCQEDLLKAADNAMYYAKNHGRNNFHAGYSV